MIPDGNKDLHRRMKSKGNGNCVYKYMVFSLVILISLKDNWLLKIAIECGVYHICKSKVYNNSTKLSRGEMEVYYFKILILSDTV